MIEQLQNILRTIIHPEYNKDIVSLGMVEKEIATHQAISFTIRLLKAHDPAATSLRRAATQAVTQAIGIEPSIIIADPVPVNTKEEHKKNLRQNSATGGIKKIIAISSGKGGVGKSSVTANLAVSLAKRGVKVGILDADIYGPSMPIMFSLQDYTPIASDQTTPANDPLILPAEKYGVKIMSIGFFIKSTDALVWRGPMATSALRQLIHQTLWGPLDILLIDLPPGTGDIHLTLVNELKIDHALIVTTPQMVALADVVRGIAMFQAPNVNINIMGIIENMAYFTPKDQPDKKYYIFGKDKTTAIAQQANIPILDSIAIQEQLATDADNGTPIALHNDMFDKLSTLISC